MSHDQCPTTVKGEKQRPAKADLASMSRSAGTVNGRRVWRSEEDLADAPEFREWLEREFPTGMSELVTRETVDLSEGGKRGGESRREFLKLMGASMALAGAATIPGCRRPDHKILPYSKIVPEEVIPGKPLFYATSYARPDGGVEGLLVETHEGRPTKIEGNPLHPMSRGKASAWALASIMGLYDIDRLKNPVYANPTRGRVDATWDDFRAWAGEHLAGYAGHAGEGAAFVIGKSPSPTRRAAIAALRVKYPKAEIVHYSPAESRGSIEGTRLAFGRPMREVLNFGKATTRVIVSLDRDFLGHEAGEVPNCRGFAKSREVFTTGDEMSRLYVVESGFSVTGAAADHRLRLSPGRVAAFAVELAKFVLPKAGSAASALASAVAGVMVPAGADIDRRFVEECAKDLLDATNSGAGLVLAGESQSAEVHALAAALNGALGNIGKSITYVPMTEDEAADSAGGLAALASKMTEGKVSLLVCVGANPAYDAPGDVDFAGAMAKVKDTVTWSVESTETAAASTWALNGAGYLESWGDTIAMDGTLAPVQPMIAPLYEPAMSDIEFLGLLATGDFAHSKPDGYQMVRGHWQRELRVGGADFEKAWRRALHDGVAPGTGRTGEAPAVNYAGVAAAAGGLKVAPAPTQDAMEVVFRVGNVADGRLAHAAWLHELPETGTRTVWDNPVLMSPATATALGLAPKAYSERDPNAIYTSPKYPMAAVAEITVGAGKVKAPVWMLPGMADNTVVMTLGYGRTVSGRVADGVGVNLYRAMSSGAKAASASAARASATGESYMIASTQNHWSLEGRTSIVRAVDLPAWKKFGGEVQKIADAFYGTEKELAFGERLGELSHTPRNVSIYANPFNRSPEDADGKHVSPTPPGAPNLARATPAEFSVGPQWAMTIDQTLCTGCGTCTIACQSENNIPVVGKKEVAKGREMTWIRVDRYYTGGFNEPEAMFHQPVLCVHCENAPCETVCPVNATVHGPEGINYMTYNRCIGTRYCANNCPYKVRRYNFFEYGKLAFNGDYMGKDTLDKLGDMVPGQGVGPNGSPVHNKININFIPPRLREKISELERMQKNPDVTVRMRGIMEKCSFCIQRINAARIETKLTGLAGIPDGFFQTACQQACPSEAIVFGDMLDDAGTYKDDSSAFAKEGVRTGSRVRHTRGNARNYQLLGYLNTRPRVTHMVRVMNPNPALCSDDRKHGWEHPFHHDEGHDHGHEHAFIDTRKKTEDRGYSMSLRILAGRNA